MTARTYSSPERFKTALEARVRTTAAATAKDMNRVRQLIIYSRFLARVFAGLGNNAIAKGGVVMELRVQRARATRDVDLWIAGRQADVLSQLTKACTLDLNDWMTFVIEPDKEHPALEAEGLFVDVGRFRAECRLAGRLYGMPFGVDAACGDAVTLPAEFIDGDDALAFAGVERPRFRVYPRATHVAEKLHAYTRPRARENSRVKDLPDIALLAQTGPFLASELRATLMATFRHRGTHALPASLPPPPAAWIQSYLRMAKQHGLLWNELAQVHAAAASFLDPVLAAIDGEWRPDEWKWTSPGTAGS